jgi:outer membrane protein TolC
MSFASRTIRAALALSLAAGGAVCLAGEPARPGEPGAQQPGTPAAQETTLAQLVAPPLTEAEERLRSQLQPRIAADAQSAVARRTWRYLRSTDAAMLGLKKNLVIRLAGRQPLLAEQALLEARAVFDPVLQVNVSDSQTRHAVRWITTEITRMTFAQGACQAIPTPPGAATNGRPDVTQICFAVPGATQVLAGPAYAAPAPDEHPGKNEVVSTVVELTQRLPWGPVLKLVESSIYNQTYYSVANSYFTYDKPWTSSMFVQLTLPLPGTKGFGPFSQGDFAIRLAETNAQRAPWEVKAAINGILLQIDLAFWDVVESAENLAATMENKKLVESIAARIERMYKQQLVSGFEKAQMDAELARVGVEEELALRTYYSASTALAALVEDEPGRIADQILFPAGYAAEPPSGERPTLDQAQQASLERRPELQVRRAELEANKLAAGFAENQARPDISADLSTTLAQNGSVIGYNTVVDSFGRLKVPDRLSSSGALTYVLPLGQRAAKAALKTANTNVQASEHAARISANEVIREVNDAFAAYSSALARVTQAEEALKLSEFAYRLVERRFEIGEFVSQVELNRNRREVLGARTSLISARIDVRRAWSRLLGAQGVLAERYPEMHAYNDFERSRLAALAASKALRFFAAQPAGAAARTQ